MEIILYLLEARELKVQDEQKGKKFPQMNKK